MGSVYWLRAWEIRLLRTPPSMVIKLGAKEQEHDGRFQYFLNEQDDFFSFIISHIAENYVLNFHKPMIKLIKHLF